MKKKQNIVIVGLGLLGTSLALALKKNSNYRVMGWARKCEVRNKLLKNGTIEHTDDSLIELLKVADITILSLPIPIIQKYIVEYGKYFKKGSCVTDVGSVKSAIVYDAENELSKFGVNFIGSHPMAGTENSGPDAAFSTLYDNAIVFLTPTQQTSKRTINQVSEMWKSIKTTTIEIFPEKHDEIVAFTSHISHLIAMALSLSVLGTEPNKRELRKKACCSAFRDCTRVASSSPSMWKEIISNNKDEVLSAIESFKNELNIITDSIKNNNFDEFENMFASARNLRNNWLEERDIHNNQCKKISKK